MLWTHIKIHLAGVVEVLDNCWEVAQDKLRPQPDAQIDLKGKRAIVTGGNAGIGLATAEQLVRHGADVVLACRSKERGQAAAQALSQVAPACGCKQAGTVQVEQVDLLSLESVSSFCDRIVAIGGADLLLLNAGIMAPPQRGESTDGFERQFQTNYLSHWLIANRLVAYRRQRRRRQGQCMAAEMRTVFFSSMTHMAADLHLSDLQASRRYDGFLQYANTKLACLLAAKELQRRLDRYRLSGEVRDTAVAVHPGLVDTWLARTYFKQHFFPQFLRPLTDPLLEHVLCPAFLRTPRAAARLVLLACTVPEDKAAGQYFAGRGVATAAAAAENEQLGQALWKHTRQLCIAAGSQAEQLL